MDAAAFARKINSGQCKMKIKLIIFLSLLLSSLSALAQMPCTKEDANRKLGKWSVVEDDLAMADPTFPKAQFQTVLPKANKGIELIRKAIPNLTGVEARTYRGIRGYPYIENGTVMFQSHVGFFPYSCIPDTSTYIQSARGQIRLIEETYTWIEIFFNGFGWLTNEKKRLSKDFLTVNGGMMYEFPKETGNLKGFAFFQHDLFPYKSEAVLILPENKFPFRFISREEYLKARIQNYEIQINKLPSSASRLIAEYQSYIAKYNEILAEMSLAELKSPAVIRNYYGGVGKEKVFADEDKDGKRLAVIKKSFFKPNLPRNAVQFITIYFRWNDKNPAESAVIRQFKENFDFQTLKEMLGK